MIHRKAHAVSCTGGDSPLTVQMQETWLSWALGGQPRNKSFQPFLKEKKEANVITPDDDVL